MGNVQHREDCRWAVVWCNCSFHCAGACNRPVTTNWCTLGLACIGYAVADALLVGSEGMEVVVNLSECAATGKPKIRPGGKFTKSPGAKPGGKGGNGGDGGGGGDGPKPGDAGGPGAGKKFPKKIGDAERSASGTKCRLCGVDTIRHPKPHPRRSNLDHAIPKSRGGNNGLGNAQNTCQTCNLRKGAKTTREFLNGGR